MPRTIRLAPCLLLLAAVPVFARTASQDQGLPALQVPGGTAPLCEAFGIGGNAPGGQAVLAAIRVLWSLPQGIDPVFDQRRGRGLDYLRSLDGQPQNQPGADVPAFLPADAWARLLRELSAAGGSPFTAILGNRRTALMYYGLASLDEATRSYLASRPALLEEVSREGRVELFATLGRSIRVRDDRIEPPGGAEAVPLWEEVARASVEKPADFILNVLDRNDGRLALLYDAVAHVEEPARRFALGFELPADKRVKRFRAFYGEAGKALGNWQPASRPFERIPFDAVQLLISTRFEDDGHLAGPPWRAFWKAAFEPALDVTKGLKPQDLGDEDRCDAARMLEMVSVGDPVERERRARTWFFAHRVFRAPARSDVRDVLLAVNSYSSYPSLFLALERMGVEAPATYAAAATAARSLTASDRRLWLFQAGLAVLEETRSSRAIDAKQADTLVRALCEATPAAGSHYRGAVARWLVGDLLAAAGEPLLPEELAATDRPLETRLLAAMAGSVASPANKRLLALEPIEWEGLAYRLDPGTSTLRRLVDVRARQGGPSLDAVLELAREADALAAAARAPAAVAAAGRAVAAAASLRAAAAERARQPRIDGGEPDLERLAAAAAQKAGRLGKTDARATAGIARPLQEAADYHLAAVLASIVYAPHVGEPGSPALLGGDPSTVHDLRFFEPRTELGRRTAWQLPVEVRDERVAWGVSGSLLNLEMALGRFSLRRVFTESMPPPPTLSDAERQTFTENALFSSAFDIDGAGREALLLALERGRERAGALTGPGEEVDRFVADAGIDEWRAQAFAWTIAREPSRRLDLLSLAELALAGGLESRPGRSLDAWGTSGYARDRALGAFYPARLCWTTIAGRRGVRAVPAFVLDLAIGLAESSLRLGLPAEATPGLLLVASARFVETVQAAYPDDWPAMVSHAQVVARTGVEDYVAALTISGPLVPVEQDE